MPTPPSRPFLVLWDIDHTLIETRGTGGRLARAAFQQITGIEPERMAVATGKTEPIILEETLRAHGIEPTEDHQRRFAEALPEQYRRHADELRRAGRVLPGAAETIAVIAERGGAIQSVLTGNYRAVAAIKLATFDLAGLDLDIGAYADDATDRTTLVAIAQQRASEKHRAEFTRANTVVIGDTTHDVTAALRGGAAIVAVASGKTSADELRAAGAQVVLDDLRDAAAVITTPAS